MLRGASLLSTLFLSACATTAPVPLGNEAGDLPSPVASPPVVSRPTQPGSVSSDCDAILRDLSVEWDSRDYWCDKGQPSVRKSVLLASLEEARLQLVELRRSAESIERNTDRAMDRIDSRLASEEWVASPPVTAPVEVPVSDSRIVFAHGRVVLGPRGRRAVAALSQRVASSRRVTLRGYLSEGEFTFEDSQDAERRSVGRSLSVKEAWRDFGIDVATVTILHHADHFDDPYVEVVFSD